MKRFFHTGKSRVLVGVTAVLLILAVLSAGFGRTATSSFLGMITAPLQGAGTAAMRAIGDALGVNDHTEELDALREENRLLREQLVDYYDVKRQNIQYASILEIKEQNKDFEFVAAAVIGRDPNDLYYGFSIDQGSLNGISVNDPVITSDGVVGIVTEVYATTSRVKTILSPDLEISAVSTEFRESGVTSSNITTAEAGCIRLNYLTRDTKIKENTIITTSGLSGVYPKGLVLGYVTSVQPSEYDVSYCATVQPCVDIKNVTDVFVITDFLGQGESSNAIFDEQTGGDK